MSGLKQFHIELRDLQALLCKKCDQQFSVISYCYESLVPIGENYGSTVFKVHAHVKQNNEAIVKELHLVAKMPPATEFQRLLFDSAFTFRKEVFFYEELIPIYQRLEREFGIAENAVFDILPRFYGARSSLKSDVDFDDDAVILMDNLKMLGFYTGDRRKGLDLPHCKISLYSLARFHALGIALKRYNLDEFENIKKQAKCRKIVKDEGFENINHFFLQLMQNDSKMGIYGKNIQAAMSQDLVKVMITIPSEPWGTIIHNDFWVNNIMFHTDSLAKSITGVKFIDFQNYLFLSPMRELIFFLSTSLNEIVMTNHFDELLDYYYDNFISVLVNMKCNVEQFQRDKFEKRMKIDAIEEFPHIPFMLRIIFIDVKDDFKLDNDEIRDFMLAQSCNKLFLDRLRRCVEKYVEKGWF